MPRQYLGELLDGDLAIGVEDRAPGTAPTGKQLDHGNPKISQLKTEGLATR
jgi:hypothetical protein